MTVNWITTEIDDQSGTRGSDMDGNKYFSPIGGETVYCTTPDGRKGCGWTAAQALESALSETSLLPCPFCGSDNIVFERDEIHNSLVAARCSYCGCSPGYCGSEEEAGKAWNIRHPEIKICEGCHEIITPDRFPHLERVWPETHRQYWHTNCFVYAYPPSTFEPPIGPSREVFEEGLAVTIDDSRDTPWVCTCGAGDKEAPDHNKNCKVYCPF